MKTGDPRQVVVLGVVAVLAIGFAVMRAIPRGSSAPPTRPQAAAAEPATTLAEEPTLATLVTGDPFAHPWLTPAAKRDPLEEPPPAPPRRTPAPVVGTLPPADPRAFALEPIGTSPLPQLSETPNAPPVANAGNSQHQEEKPKPAIGVRAVMAVENPIAYISVGEGEAVARRVGETLAPGIRLVAIREDGVQVSVMNKRRTIRVGETVQP